MSICTWKTIDLSKIWLQMFTFWTSHILSSTLFPRRSIFTIEWTSAQLWLKSRSQALTSDKEGVSFWSSCVLSAEPSLAKFLPFSKSDIEPVCMNCGSNFFGRLFSKVRRFPDFRKLLPNIILNSQVLIALLLQKLCFCSCLQSLLFKNLLFKHFANLNLLLLLYDPKTSVLVFGS